MRAGSTKVVVATSSGPASPYCRMERWIEPAEASCSRFRGDVDGDRSEGFEGRHFRCGGGLVVGFGGLVLIRLVFLGHRLRGVGELPVDLAVARSTSMERTHAVPVEMS